MIYPDTIEAKLGFDVIRQRLAGYCSSALGRNEVAAVKFRTEVDEIKSLLAQVEDFKQLLDLGEVPPLGTVTDISESIRKSSIKGNWLSGEELYAVYRNIASALALASFIDKVAAAYVSLATLRPEIKVLGGLAERLQRAVAEEGTVLSSASPELKKIRQQITSEESKLRQSINRIFRQAKADGLVPEGASIGVRDGRLVMPVIAASKRQVQGFVHDESATGNTVFMEPAAVLEANNKIRELHFAEARAVRAVLTKLTGQVAGYAGALHAACTFLGKMDFLWAKARLARELQAANPQISREGMNLQELRHPLLAGQGALSQRQVVPHTITLDPATRIMLISGPNAGGKSVALKSVGLNQMMLQAGILPCSHADANYRVFQHIFIDIGDEQSIDNDLSTYSSHLKNMGVMLKNADPDSLILIDEFGSGTDPQFGGAIAEAVLAGFNQQGCYGIITTHFGNLKLYADKTAGIINAAMVFDLEKLRPRYQLQAGHPGSSFSLEVAAKAGLPARVIKLAREGVGADQVEIEALIHSLEQEKQKLAARNRKLAALEKELSALKKSYQQLQQELDARQKEIIEGAKTEAAGILARTNREIEKTIRHIKENKAEKKETRKVRASLQKFAQEVAPKKGRRPSEATVAAGPIKAGDRALLIENQVPVEVLAVKGKKATVLIGELKSVIALDKLQRLAGGQAPPPRQPKKTASVAARVTREMANFSPVLDVRGTRAAEVIPLLQNFLDKAVMLNQGEVKIIHGRGNGVLRKLVRDELRQWPQVVDFGSEHEERGGDGATVVVIK